VNNRTDVIKLAVGKWPSILMHFGVDERAVSGKHAPCPMCGGKDRFRMLQLDGPGNWICNQCGHGDGMDLLMGFTGQNFKQAAEALRPVVGGCHYVPPNVIKPKDRKKIMAKNVELWRSGIPVTDFKAELLHEYLAFRGLRREEYEPADLRLVEKLPFYDEDGNRKGQMPAMLARVCTRDGKLALIHRTYLGQQSDGGFKTKKKMTSSARDWKGGCVRLFNSTGSNRLIVAEGIETALSVRARIYRMHGTLIPAWAAVSADAMMNIALPEHITKVMVAGDNDTSFTGQKAAFTLANRLKVHDKRKVQVVLPNEPDTDFNDELKRITPQEVQNVSGK
jgi:putative DNA primase/helicase